MKSQICMIGSLFCAYMKSRAVDENADHISFSQCLQDGRIYLLLSVFQPAPVPKLDSVIELLVRCGIQHTLQVEAEKPLGVAGIDSGTDPKDYINITSYQEVEYVPVSYQTCVYDQKWIVKLCVQNYRIGSVLTEMYTHAEHPLCHQC